MKKNNDALLCSKEDNLNYVFIQLPKTASGFNHNLLIPGHFFLVPEPEPNGSSPPE